MTYYHSEIKFKIHVCMQRENVGYFSRTMNVNDLVI